MRGRYVNKLQRKMFRSAFVTAAFTEFTQIIALTIDSILVCSYLGELEIAAVGLSGPFLFLVGIPASALSSGLQTVCTQEMGRGHIEGVSRRFSETLILTSIFLTAATALVLLTVPQLAGILGAGAEVPELLEPTSQYLYGLSIEIIPFILYSVLIPVVILDNDSSLVMISSLVGCAANISFDLLAIVNHWGLFGIGLGSSMSVLISFGVLLIHFLRKDRVIRFRFVRIKGKEVLEVLHLGLPKAVHAVASMIRSLVMNALVLSVGGSIAMSVLTIHGTVMDFVDIIAVGIAGAVGVLSGIAYGELNGEEAERYCGEGHFAPGSMLPKVKAAISFAKTGGEAIIASLENAGKAVRGESGTVVHL